MKTFALLFALVILAPWASAQRVNLKLDHLKAKAKEVVECDLDGASLKFVKSHVGEAGFSLDGVWVRNFEFEAPGGYSDADVEAVIKQVRGAAGWSRVARVKDREDHVEVYLMIDGEKAIGALIVVAEPRELTVVNAAGSVSLEKARELVSNHVDCDFKHLLGQRASKR